jgi:hypothetical protein
MNSGCPQLKTGDCQDDEMSPIEKEAGYTSWYGIRYGISPFGPADLCKSLIIRTYG